MWKVIFLLAMLSVAMVARDCVSQQPIDIPSKGTFRGVRQSALGQVLIRNDSGAQGVLVNGPWVSGVYFR